MRAVRRRTQESDDEGFALLTVLLVLLIVTLLSSVLMANAIQSLPEARHEQGYSAALAAAEAGVDDFIDRLDQNYNYATQLDSNAALTSYVNIAPGTVGTYSYRVDRTTGASNGTTYLNVTGKVGNVKRSIRVGLRPYGFLDWMLMTDYSLLDPSLGAVPGSLASLNANCVYHAWENNASRPGTKGPDLSNGSCGQLVDFFATGQTLTGPIHANDDLYVCGSPAFQATVTSGDPGTGPYAIAPSGFGCTQTATFSAGAPIGNKPLTIPGPQAASGLLTFAQPTTSTGCLYTGPTSITLNSSGTMNVVSPLSRSTNASCVGVGVPLPADGVIYVQDVPTAAADPNYSVRAACPAALAWWSPDPNCGWAGDAYVQGTLKGQLTIYASSDIIATGNILYNSTSTSSTDILGLISGNGPVYVNHPVTTTTASAPQPKCSASGTPTVASGYCNWTGTVTLSWPSSGSTVSFATPIANAASTGAPTIEAAILAQTHALSVDNFNQGPPLGAIDFFGSASGEFMYIDGEASLSGGAVTQIAGYLLNAQYDTRLANGGLIPPQFFNPQNTQYHRIAYAEIPNPSWS